MGRIGVHIWGQTPGPSRCLCSPLRLGMQWEVTLFTPLRPQYVFFVVDQRPCFTPKQIITYMLAWGDAMCDFAKIRRGPRFVNIGLRHI